MCYRQATAPWSGAGRLLRTGDANYVHHRIWQTVLTPARTIVVRAEDLAAAGTEVDLFWVLRMNGHAEGGAVWRHVTIKPFPAISQVSTAEHTSLRTAKIFAHTSIEGIGIIGSSLHTARIGDRRKFFQMQVLPRVALVPTAPYH